MDIQDILSLKDSAETDIFNILDEFRKTTGLSVERIEIVEDQYIGQRRPQAAYVVLEVRLK